MTEEQDPRIYYAAERTLLAWMRSGLAVIGVGFLVARFGLFLAMFRHNGSEAVVPPLGSSFIGIGFVLLGAFIISASAWQHSQFCRELKPNQLPVRHWISMGVYVSALMALLGFSLAAYLLLSVHFGK